MCVLGLLFSVWGQGSSLPLPRRSFQALPLPLEQRTDGTDSVRYDDTAREFKTGGTRAKALGQ